MRKQTTIHARDPQAVKPGDQRQGGLSIGNNTTRLLSPDRQMNYLGICISPEFPAGPFTSAVRRELEKRD